MTAAAEQFEALARAATQGGCSEVLFPTPSSTITLAAWVSKNRALIAAALRGGESVAREPVPFVYAYRYPTINGTVILFNGGVEHNGSRPIEAIPLYTRGHMKKDHIQT